MTLLEFQRLLADELIAGFKELADAGREARALGIDIGPPPGPLPEDWPA